MSLTQLAFLGSVALVSSLFPKVELPNTPYHPLRGSYRFGRAQPIARSRSLLGTFWIRNAKPVVQEYLPAVHHLRLFGLGLGPTNPGRINLPRETLGLRRTGFPPVLSLLIPA